MITMARFAIAALLFTIIESFTNNYLIDLPNFQFHIDGAGICDEKTDVLFYVSSALEHRQFRDAIRDTWGNWTKLSEVLSYRVIFLFGESDNNDLKWKLEKERVQNGDIVQGSFADTYANLTYKHMMGLKWAEQFCPHAKFIAKVDDDIYIDIYSLADELRTRFGLDTDTKHLICCGHMFRSNHVIRDKSDKYYVSKTEWSRDGTYPPFCSGAAIMYSKDVATELLEESTVVKYFKLEDVYATGLLRQRIGVSLKTFEKNLEWRPKAVQEVIEKKQTPQFLFALTKRADQIRLLWKVTRADTFSKMTETTNLK